MPRRPPVRHQPPMTRGIGCSDTRPSPLPSPAGCRPFRLPVSKIHPELLHGLPNSAAPSVRLLANCPRFGRTRSEWCRRISWDGGDEPSPSERAAHHGMTLFALHRQGKSATAHVPQAPFGRAVRELARHRAIGEGDEAEGVRRRFDALVTASTAEEGAYHLRGLILMLRDAGLSIDYGLLAQDLADLLTPARRDAARLRWARQYRMRRSRQPSDATPDRKSTR